LATILTNGPKRIRKLFAEAHTQKKAREIQCAKELQKIKDLKKTEVLEETRKLSINPYLQKLTSDEFKALKITFINKNIGLTPNTLDQWQDRFPSN